MKTYYAIRKHKVIEVVHLRGKLYCPKEKADTIREEKGKKYADEELLIGSSNLFETRKEAGATRKSRSTAKALKTQREKEELQAYLADRDRLIDELMALANSQDMELVGVGLATNEQLERDIRRLKNLANNE